jgi:predicted lipoprotein with Yx(FWY)xxD motif
LEKVMRHPRTIIAIVGVTVALGVSGIAVALSSGGSSAAGASSKAAAVTPVMTGQPSASSATIHTENATVGGKTEAILVNAKGLPLYTYKPDTATKSFVSGGLAMIWPPLVSMSPTIEGATGKLSVTNDASGTQVAYNGHFLYTFASDTPGHVTGQGFENFFVATPGLAPIGTSSSASTAPASATSSGGGYGY